MARVRETVSPSPRAVSWSLPTNGSKIIWSRGQETPPTNDEINDLVKSLTRVIKTKDNDIRYCYEREITHNPDAKGKIRVGFELNESNRFKYIEVNGEELKMDTDRSTFETFITSSVKKGTNDIEIDPHENFRIDELKVQVQE